ncbi:DNAJ heat shock N-terminal domain-containing protein [Heterostelium album PN500]|uniref:DNAJ heat shock N-terminal domain-containing protein n=1 Tax=Heterostelium pallidum (strain ATCC 26659 / Pp 5 / PN500) TaxID=670386 RepID=D3B793_HETP5|nr:DNAJ heat shock N-terminal domain-containing protein [Heterostelium album PN500]EFA82636.1 DNAJ heat shock N-terminal domain-containing protein [Heterostelium album PN500]|eukprot:XP_020434753.1 DNAJ heat shock N-terminal domain-containing protein [Heterostelium album PN500]
MEFSTGQLDTFFKANQQQNQMPDSLSSKFQESIQRLYDAMGTMEHEFLKSTIDVMDHKVIQPLKRDQDYNRMTKQLLDKRKKLNLDYDSIKKSNDAGRVSSVKQEFDLVSKKTYNHLHARSKIRCKLIVHSIVTMIQQFCMFYESNALLLEGLLEMVEPLVNNYQLSSSDLADLYSAKKQPTTGTGIPTTGTATATATPSTSTSVPINNSNNNNTTSPPPTYNEAVRQQQHQQQQSPYGSTPPQHSPPTTRHQQEKLFNVWEDDNEDSSTTTSTNSKASVDDWMYPSSTTTTTTNNSNSNNSSPSSSYTKPNVNTTNNNGNNNRSSGDFWSQQQQQQQQSSSQQQNNINSNFNQQQRSNSQQTPNPQQQQQQQQQTPQQFRQQQQQNNFNNNQRTSSPIDDWMNQSQPQQQQQQQQSQQQQTTPSQQKQSSGYDHIFGDFDFTSPQQTPKQQQHQQQQQQSNTTPGFQSAFFNGPSSGPMPTSSTPGFSPHVDHHQHARQTIEPGISDRVKHWAEKNNRRNNIRVLLATLHEVLWEESGWEKITLGAVITPVQVKKVYRKAIMVVHPDKVNNGTLEQKMIAQRIFESLREEYEVFRIESEKP